MIGCTPKGKVPSNENKKRRLKMDREIRTCGHCGQQYFVENRMDCYPGCREREEIICPHCGEIDGYMKTSGVPHTSKV